jgi:hypothetical protein
MFYLLSMSGTVFYAIRFARLAGTPLRLLTLVLVALVVIFTASTLFVVQQSMYVNGHAMMGCLIMLLIGEIMSLESLVGHDQARRSASLVTILSLLLLVIFARLEGLLVALLLIIIFLETQVARPWEVFLGTFLLSVPVILWAQCIQQPTAGGLTLTSSKKIYGAIAPYFCLATIYCMSPIRSHLYWLRPLSLYALGGALATYLLVDPVGYSATILSTSSNMTISVPWGIFWVVTLTLVFSPLAISRDEIGARTKYLIVAYIALTLALGGLRTPYRLGWGDSANRMMIHIVPLVTFFLIQQGLSTGLCARSKDN